jgi:3-dehydroquinate synthase
MQTIRVELAMNAYPVYLGRGLLAERDLWDRHLGSGRVLIVSNDVVAPLYLEPLERTLAHRAPAVHIVPDGEQFKTLETWQGILDRLVALKARRDAVILALGGGVVGDISGFAAASYMRGVRFVQAPTTLLAQVDASVGGKTGVNHPEGKNLIGAFHQPAAVVIDSATLETLPAREFRAGLAEVVKYGALGDPEFFDWLEAHAGAINNRDAEALDYLIARSVTNKARIVAEDEKEAGVRALLNLGHSFAHAIEAETDYREFLHGEAVAIGMVTAARLSENRGLAPPGTADRLARLLAGFGLPVTIRRDLAIDGLERAMQLDKKAVASGLRLILLDAIGRARVDAESTQQEIVTALEQSRAA